MTKNWQPASIRPAYLIFNIILTLALLGVVELLLRLSQSRNGFKLETRWLEWVPTVVGVAFGMVWAYADQNFKRMEPYFRMAQKGGAPARDSVTLQYPYLFAPFAPWIAAKRGHWIVMLSGIALIISNYAVTPFMTTIFSYEQVLQNVGYGEGVLWGIRPLEEQPVNLSPDFGFRAFDYVWNRKDETRETSLPEWATEEGAILPFRLPPGEADVWNTESAVRYSARLDCREAMRTEERHAEGWLQFVYLKVAKTPETPACVIPMWEGFKPGNITEILGNENSTWYDVIGGTLKNWDISEHYKTYEISWLKNRINNMVPHHAIWGDLRQEAPNNIVKTPANINEYFNTTMFAHYKDGDRQTLDFDCIYLSKCVDLIDLQWDKIHRKDERCDDGHYSFLGIWNTWPFSAGDLEAAMRDEIPKRRIIDSAASTMTFLRNIDYNHDRVPLRAIHWIVHPETRAPNRSNMTAVVCRPIYTQQRVSLQYNKSATAGKRLSNIQTADKPQPLSSAVNTSIFETMITMGYTPWSSEAMNFSFYSNFSKNSYDVLQDLQYMTDLIETTSKIDGVYRNYSHHSAVYSAIPMVSIEEPIETDIQNIYGFPDHTANLATLPQFQNGVSVANRMFNSSIKQSTLHQPTSSLLPFGLAMLEPSTLRTLDTHAGPSELANMLNDAYSLLFTLAIAEYVKPPEENTANKKITLKANIVGEVYIVDILWARLLQGALLLVALLSAAILINVNRRYSHLRAEPNSIFSTMASITTSNTIKCMFNNAATIPENKLHSTLEEHNGYFLQVNSNDERIENITEGYDAARTDSQFIPLVKELQIEAGDVPEARPLERNPYLMYSVISGLLIVLLLLAVVFFIDKRDQGFYIRDAIVHKIVFSYVPNVVSMIIDAFFLMINRFGGVVAPFSDLAKRNASVRTLLLSYESTPPQLLLLKSLQNGHKLLSITAVASILSVFLTISFAGLFQQSAVRRQNSQDFNYVFNPIINITNLENFLDMPQFPDETNIKIVGIDSLEPKGKWSFLNQKELKKDLNSRYTIGKRMNTEAHRSMYSVISNSTAMPQPLTDNTYFLPFTAPKSSWQTLNGTLLGYTTEVKCRAINITSELTTIEIFPNRIYIGWGDHKRNKLTYRPMIMSPWINSTACSSTALYINRPDNHRFKFNDYLHLLQPCNRHDCRGTFKAAWLTKSSSSQYYLDDNLDLDKSDLGDIILLDEEYMLSSKKIELSEDASTRPLVVSCNTKLKQTKYNVIMNQNQIINYTHIDDLPTAKMIGGSGQDLHALFQAYISTQETDAIHSETWVNGTNPTSWFSYFLHAHSPETFRTFPPKDPSRVIEEVYKKHFVLFLKAYEKQIFMPASASNPPAILKVTWEERRTRVHRGFWITSVCIIFYMLGATVLVYWCDPGKALPILPVSLATTWALIGTDSRWMKEDMPKCKGMGPWEREQWVRKCGVKWGYGEFVGTNGSHVRRIRGVEKEPWLYEGGESGWKNRN